MSLPATSAPPVMQAAVVVHYRDAAATERCVASLLAQEPALEVVVVDNASPDGSGERLRRAFADRPGVHLLHAQRNGGFGAGCNLGIDAALRRWPTLAHVLLLNPDAELDDGGLAGLLATSARHPAAGVVGCRIDDADGRPWFENGRLPRWSLSGFHCAAPGADEFATGFVTGACMLLRADLLRDGLRFDESYFLYCEDADLCCEVLARGRELWITHAARARHAAGGSQPGRPVLGELGAERLYWLTRGKVLFARRRLGWLERSAFVAIAALAKPLAAVLTGRGRGIAWIGPYYRGLWCGLTARLGRRPRGRPGSGS